MVVPQFDKDNDFLSVTMNAKQLKLSIDYKTSDDGKYIETIDGVVSNSSGCGVTFTFFVIKKRNKTRKILEI